MCNQVNVTVTLETVTLEPDIPQEARQKTHRFQILTKSVTVLLKSKFRYSGPIRTRRQRFYFNFSS